MKHRYLFAAISYAVASFLFYKIYTWWLKVREKKQKLNELRTRIDKFKYKIAVVMLIVAAIIYFYKWLAS